MSIDNKPGEHDAGTIMEGALVIGLDNFIDNVQGINSDNIPLWNDWPIHYSDSGSCHVFLCPLSNSVL
jgi:hypothetical protein